MSKRVLLSSGTGFLGPHIADLPLSTDHSAAFFNTVSPACPPSGERPDYPSPDAALIVGDVRDLEDLAIDGVDRLREGRENRGLAA